MKIRLISGSCYVAILVAFYCLKVFVHDLCFDALLYAFALIGTFEMLRAMSHRLTRAEKNIVFAFAAVVIPLCAAFETVYAVGLEIIAVCFFIFSLALLSLLVIRQIPKISALRFYPRSTPQ